MYGMVISSPSLIGRTAVRTREKRLRSHSHFALGSQLRKKKDGKLVSGIEERERERGKKVLKKTLTYDYTCLFGGK